VAITPIKSAQNSNTSFPNRMKVITMLSVVISLAGQAGEGDVTARPFKPNPTDYVFDSSAPKVISTFDQLVREKIVLGRFVFISHERDSAAAIAKYKAISIFGKANVHDVYFQGKLPLWYVANYDISVSQVNLSQCLVKIRAMNAAVIVPGHRFNVHTLKFDQGKRINVTATTIEEYELLLEIGRRLGQMNMSALCCPID